MIFFNILYLFRRYPNLISVHVQEKEKGMEIEYGEKSKLEISGKGIEGKCGMKVLLNLSLIWR